MHLAQSLAHSERSTNGSCYYRQLHNRGRAFHIPFLSIRDITHELSIF